MRYTVAITGWATATVLLFAGLGMASSALAAGKVPSPAACKQNPSGRVAEGGCIVIDRRKGNCMACHRLAGGDEAGLQQGNIAPPLIAMKQRFNRSDLRAQIADPLAKNPNTSMPPFGVHEILTDEEIDKVVDFLMTL